MPVGSSDNGSGSFRIRIGFCAALAGISKPGGGATAIGVADEEDDEVPVPGISDGSVVSNSGGSAIGPRLSPCSDFGTGAGTSGIPPGGAIAVFVDPPLAVDLRGFQRQPGRSVCGTPDLFPSLQRLQDQNVE